MPTFVGFTCNKGEIIGLCNFHLVPYFKECSPNLFINKDRLFVIWDLKPTTVFVLLIFFWRIPMNYNITLLSSYNVINLILKIIKWQLIFNTKDVKYKCKNVDITWCIDKNMDHDLKKKLHMLHNKWSAWTFKYLIHKSHLTYTKLKMLILWK
jgi:hypothetical protein